MYEKFLVKLTDQLFDMAYMEGLTWIGFAKRAGVSYTTVYNLGMRITRYPQLRTIYRLAKAVGLDVRLIKEKVHTYEKAEGKV